MEELQEKVRAPLRYRDPERQEKYEHSFRFWYRVSRPVPKWMLMLISKSVRRAAVLGRKGIWR